MISPLRLICFLMIGQFLALSQGATSSFAQEKGIADFPKLSASRDWPWWRGPQRNGYADSSPVPTKFSESENVVWKVPVPGRGHSSPIVVGDRVYLTTADAADQIHSVLAFDRATGKLLWNVNVNQGGFPERNHAKNTEATPSVASDGERLFASFYHHDKVEVVALDFNGMELWKRDAGKFRPRMFEYGYAPSPLIYRDTVIIAGEYDGPSFLTALKRETGEPVWSTPRPTNITFSTPVVTHVAGKDQLLISGGAKVVAYNPENGKSLWSAAGTTFATCGTMVWDGENVFASGGYPKAETIAIKADGSHKVLWRNSQKCYEQSMLAVDGHLYAFTGGGVFYCWRGHDGKEMWKSRLKGPVSASPVLANGNIYWANEMGTMYVIRATPEKFDLIAENQVGTDSFPSPAICGGQIFLRVGDNKSGQRQEYLYCISNPQ